MLKLKLTRDEVGTIYSFCADRHVRFEDTIYRQNMGLNSVILSEHYERLRRQWFSWSNRSPTKEFAYQIPISLALALHTELQVGMYRVYIQSLLNKLNQALVNLHFQPQTVECYD